MIDRHNHIEHYMDSTDEVKGILGSIIHANHNGNHKPSQLDRK